MPSERRRCTSMAVERHEERDPVTGRREAVLDDEGNPVLRPCKQWAMVGFDVCVMHAPGTDERTRNRAQLRKESNFLRKHEGEVRDMMSELDVPDMHPMDGLLECVRWSGAAARMLGVLVGELPIEPAIGRDPDSSQLIVQDPGLWGLDSKGEQAPHVLTQLHGVWHDRYLRACKMALDAGIDERLVRNAEATGSTLLRAFESAVASVTTLTDAQRAQLGRALAQEVRAHVSSSALDPATPSSPLTRPSTITVPARPAPPTSPSTIDVASSPAPSSASNGDQPRFLPTLHRPDPRTLFTTRLRPPDLDLEPDDDTDADL